MRYTMNNGFDGLGLSQPLLDKLAAANFTQPTEVQSTAIPTMLAGSDLLVQSQTGTGKTAAFGLPLLEMVNHHRVSSGALILTPTRELAIQIHDALQQFGRAFPRINFALLYGGSDYRTQLQALSRGAHIVIGTPGRIMDHIDRGSLKLAQIKHVVLDEADEMLRMGFVDDVDTILSNTPDDKQMAMFSATMPKPIERIAHRHLRKPERIIIQPKAKTVDNIEQYYAIVNEADKCRACVRLIQGNDFDGVIIFAKTKAETQVITQHLQTADIRAEALNGDMAQPLRKRCLDKFSKQYIQVLVATDVAARGIDIEHVSCVINTELPFDHETYVHRIGRTGRAGRSGEAYLLLTPRQAYPLEKLEAHLGKKLQYRKLPATQDIQRQRLKQFGAQLAQPLPAFDQTRALADLEQLCQQNDLQPLELAARLMESQIGGYAANIKGKGQDSIDREFHQKSRGNAGKQRRNNSGNHSARYDEVEKGMTRYRLNLGRKDGVRPNNIVGAIANEAKLSSSRIGRIAVNHQHSFVDLPSDLSHSSLRAIQQSRILGRTVRFVPEKAQPMR